MNHTFTTRTWGGNKPLADWLFILIAVVGVLLTLSIIGAPVGIVFLFMVFGELAINTKVNCPSCKAKVSVFRNAKAYSCYNCQSVIVKDHNQWRII